VGKRRQLIPLTDRQKHAWLISKAVTVCVRQDKACEVIGLSTRTLQLWRIDGGILRWKTNSHWGRATEQAKY
jgi:putative transposase